MYSTCLFCKSNLGSNDAIEHFPVGRRLAFDAANGRLWVVCRSCEKWNLTPIEERWEALEECERAFEVTRLRVSTDEIGLARIKEGLELVRIGKPKRPEFAAWRYGDQFGRRRRNNILLVSAGVAAGTGILVGQIGFGLALGASGIFSITNGLATLYRQAKTVATVHARDEIHRLTPAHIDATQLIWAQSRGQWSLLVPQKKVWTFSSAKQRALTSTEAEVFLSQSGRGDEPVIELTGEEARRGLAKVLAYVNSAGGKQATVRTAVNAIEEAGDPDRFLENSGLTFAANRRLMGLSAPKKGGNLKAIPTEVRLAMEMASNEENERHALLTELEFLKEEWRAAEEIAEISDKLLISREIQNSLQNLKNKT